MNPHIRSLLRVDRELLLRHGAAGMWVVWWVSTLSVELRVHLLLLSNLLRVHLLQLLLNLRVHLLLRVGVVVRLLRRWLRHLVWKVSPKHWHNLLPTHRALGGAFIAHRPGVCT